MNAHCVVCGNAIARGRFLCPSCEDDRDEAELLEGAVSVLKPTCDGMHKPEVQGTEETGAARPAAPAFTARGYPDKAHMPGAPAAWRP